MFGEVKHDLKLPPRIYAKYLKAASKQFADDMPEAAGWFMVKVGVKQEHKLRDRMARAGLDVWLPETTETIIRISRRKKNGKPRKLHPEEKQVLIFDGHVLVRFCPFPETWHAIMGINGVQAIYARHGAFSSPIVEKRLESALSPRTVARLRELELETHGSDNEPRYKPGQTVTITDGPFQGASATVSHKRAAWGLVSVETHGFGGLVPMVLEETQLEAA